MKDQDKFILERVIASGIMAQLSPGEQEMARQCIAECMNSLMTVPSRVATAAFLQLSADFVEQMSKGEKNDPPR